MKLIEDILVCVSFLIILWFFGYPLLSMLLSALYHVAGEPEAFATLMKLADTASMAYAKFMEPYFEYVLSYLEKLLV